MVRAFRILVSLFSFETLLPGFAVLFYRVRIRWFGRFRVHDWGFYVGLSPIYGFLQQVLFMFAQLLNYSVAFITYCILFMDASGILIYSWFTLFLRQSEFFLGMLAIDVWHEWWESRVVYCWKSRYLVYCRDSYFIKSQRSLRAWSFRLPVELYSMIGAFCWNIISRWSIQKIIVGLADWWFLMTVQICVTQEAFRSTYDASWYFDVKTPIWWNRELERLKLVLVQTYYLWTVYSLPYALG